MVRLRVVLDTNVMLRGLISETSASAEVLAAADERTFVALLSRPVIAEYREILTDDELTQRFPSLTRKRVETAIARLRFCGDYLRRVTERFHYPRDPRDAKFIELAIAGRATHLITHDADFLDLPHGKDDAAKRFRHRLPNLKVMEPRAFIAIGATQRK